MASVNSKKYIIRNHLKRVWLIILSHVKTVLLIILLILNSLAFRQIRCCKNSCPSFYLLTMGYDILTDISSNFYENCHKYEILNKK